MSVGRPARGDAALFEEHQAVSAGQRDLLVRELFGEPRRSGQGGRVEGLNLEYGQLIDQAEELDGAAWIVAPQEPAVTFGDHQGRVTRGRRIGKKPFEEGCDSYPTGPGRRSARRCRRSTQSFEP